MEILPFREKRSPILVATFRDGYAMGWRFAVTEAFKDALDIKLRTENEWTQGNQFNFIQGSVFYDTPQAYEPSWREAIQHLKLSVQIAESRPSERIVSETIETTSKQIEITTRGKGESSKPKLEMVDGLVIRKERVHFGYIKFTLYRPNKDKSAVEEVDTIECDQEEFVAFLQTGIIRTLDNKKRDLFKEYAQ